MSPEARRLISAGLPRAQRKKRLKHHLKRTSENLLGLWDGPEREKNMARGIVDRLLGVR